MLDMDVGSISRPTAVGESRWIINFDFGKWPYSPKFHNKVSQIQAILVVNIGLQCWCIATCACAFEISQTATTLDRQRTFKWSSISRPAFVTSPYLFKFATWLDPIIRQICAYLDAHQQSTWPPLSTRPQCYLLQCDPPVKLGCLTTVLL